MDKTPDQRSPDSPGTGIKRTHLLTVLILILIIVLYGSGFFAYRSAVDRQKQIWDKVGQINAQVGQINAQVGQIKTDLDQVKAQTSSLVNKLDQIKANTTEKRVTETEIPPKPEIKPRRVRTLADIFSEAPVLTTALTKDGYNYTAYFRNVLFEIDGLGWVKAAEGRFRFSLEDKGPPAFQIRVLGRSSGPYIEVKNELIRPAEERPGPLDGIGDFDANLGEYYQEGKFYSGHIRLTALSGGGFIGLVDLTLHGAREDGLFQANREVAVFLESIDHLDEQKTFHPETEAWKKYLAFLEELAKPRYQTHTFQKALELKNPSQDKVHVFLRHDMDLTMYGAMAMAAQEHWLGLKGTYFINMASGIYAVMAEGGHYRHNPAAIENLLFIQNLGHEIGYHTDALMQTLFYDLPLRGWLLSELERLRRFGLNIVTEAENGSPYIDQIGSANKFSFKDFRKGGKLCPANFEKNQISGYPLNGIYGSVKYMRNGERREYKITEVARNELGLKVSAYHLYEHLAPEGRLCRSDSHEEFENPVQLLQRLEPGKFIEIMIHPSTYTTLDPDFDFVIDPDLT